MIAVGHYIDSILNRNKSISDRLLVDLLYENHYPFVHFDNLTTPITLFLYAQFSYYEWAVLECRFDFSNNRKYRRLYFSSGEDRTAFMLNVDNKLWSIQE